MAYHINEKLQQLKPYIPVAETKGITHLDANESFLNLPDDLLQKIAAAVQQIAFNR
ncbi:MAG TPA: histidinol-phosphate transaminase, partial [Ruminococcaceae bacterium]|nr:histidinol-phosphate transaminase [Oscillospiraceae bacterium]